MKLPKIELRRRERLTGVNATVAWTALILAVLTPTLLTLPVGALVKTLAVLTFACFAPGAALLCRVRLGTAPVTWAVVLVVSMSVFALPAPVMVWTHLWHPFYAFAALVAMSVALAGSALRPAVPVEAFVAPARLRHVPTRIESVSPVSEGAPADPAPSLSTDTVIFSMPKADAGADVFALANPDAGADVTTFLPRITDAGPMPASDVTTVLPAVPPFPSVVPPPGVVPAQRTDSGETQVFARIPDVTSTIVLKLPPNWTAERSDLAVEFPEPKPPADHYDGTHRRGSSTRPVWLTGISVDGTASVQLGLLSVAAACWIVGLLQANIADIGDYGLLQAMHPLFFIGAVLCVAGFVIEIGLGARRGWLLVAHLALMLLIMHATVPILIHEPEYAWTYKHIGVIQLFRTTGRIVDPNDIYQAWPTFFAAVAQLCTLSGAKSISVAAWGPLFFDAANCLPLYAIVRTLSSDRRLPWLTVFVFTCVNWVAQDYLSPQAFAYVLCLGAILIMVRWLRGRPDLRRVKLPLINRIWAQLHVGLKAVPYVGKSTERAAVICLYFVYAIVVMSHQLSPYLIAMTAGALVLLGLMRRWQVVPILLGISLLYLLPHYGVADHYGLFDGINIFKNLLHSSQGVAPTTEVSSAGQIFSAEVVQLLSLLLWGTSAISLMMSRTRLGPVALPAVLAFAPFGLLLGQSYGGEGIYRVYLFSAPWCAYLVCRLLLGVRKIPAVAGVLAASLLISAGAFVGMQGEHGQLTFDRFTRGEVAASNYLYQHAPAGATLIEAAGNFPARLSARYTYFDGGGDPETLEPVLPTDRNTINEDDMEKIAEFCSGYRTVVYVVIAQSEVNYAHFFGYLPDGLLANLRVAMDASPFWKVVYRNGDAVVYRFDA